MSWIFKSQGTHIPYSWPLCFCFAFLFFSSRLESPPPIMHFFLLSSCETVFIAESHFLWIWFSILEAVLTEYNRGVYLRLCSPPQLWPTVHREPNHISFASPFPLFCCCIVVLFTSETNTIFIHDSSQSGGKINICVLLMKSMFLKWVVLFRARPQITCAQ